MVTDDRYAALEAENRSLREQLAVALARLADLEAKKTSPPRFVKANRPTREQTPRRKRAAEPNHARRREESTAVVEHPLTHCPDCGSRLGGVQVGRRRQVVDVPPPAAVVVTEHEIAKGRCSACQKWHEAPLDLDGAVVGQGRLGVRVAALVAHLRTALRLPIRSIQRYLVDLHGLRISVGEIVGLLQQVAAQGAATLTHIRDQVRRRPVVHADETRWPEAGRNGYARLLATPEGERYVERHASRASAVANDLVGEDFTGVLVTDFYGGYNDTPGGRHQRCWVHLLRDVHALGEAHPVHLENPGLGRGGQGRVDPPACCLAGGALRHGHGHGVGHGATRRRRVPCAAVAGRSSVCRAAPAWRAVGAEQVPSLSCPVMRWRGGSGTSSTSC